MLSVPTEFPRVGSHGFLDDGAKVEPVRILRDNGDGNVLVSLTGRRFPREIASGNRTVPLADLRATEQPNVEVQPASAAELPSLIVGQEVIHSSNLWTKHGWRQRKLRALVVDPCVKDDPDYTNFVEIEFITVDYLGRHFVPRSTLSEVIGQPSGRTKGRRR